MNKYKTAQEQFWAGEFGDNYINRNDSEELIANNTMMFSSILKKTSDVKSIIEFGSNIGMNLFALKNLLPKTELSAVEINKNAVEILKNFSGLTVHPTSILNFKAPELYDFVFTKGVLIHINPEELQNVYETMYQSSKRYICVVEYYNPSPVEINYRGHEARLYKRDFAGEIMEKYPDLKLVDYGFFYHKDPRHFQEDMTWFLMEKTDK